SHRNEILPPADPASPAYSWFVFVRAMPAAKAGAAVNVQRNVWNPTMRMWQRDAFGPAASSVRGKAAQSVEGQELTDVLIGEVAGKGIRLEPTSHIPKNGVLRVYNDLPVTLTSVSIRDMKGARPERFGDLKVPPNGFAEL